MTLSPEDQFLLCATRAGLGIGDATELDRLCSDRRLSTGLDWAYILSASMQHAVAPLVGHGLNQVAATVSLATVPDNVRSELKASLEIARARNHYLLRTAAEIAGVCGRYGIQLVGLKDIAFVTELFSDVGLRPMGDLDLMVRVEDISRAVDCLAELGFTRHDPRGNPYKDKYGFGVDLHRACDNVWVDLQHHAMQLRWHNDMCRLPVDRMWQESQDHPNPALPIRVPSDEDMLLHLCGHLEDHDYSELILVCEIAAFVWQRSSHINWQTFFDRVRESATESAVYGSLRAARELLGAPVTDELLRNSEPRFFEPTLKQAVFANLGPLHESLDDLNGAGRVPVRTMSMCELDVRKQVAAASFAYDEVHRVLGELVPSRVPIAVFLGCPSQYVFPGAPADRFGTVQLLLPGLSESAWRAILCSMQYDATGTNSDLRRSAELESIAGVAGRKLTVDVEFSNGPPSQIWEECSERSSKGQVALQALRTGGASRQNPGAISIKIDVVALPAERLLVQLASELGTAATGVLRRMCELAFVLDRVGSELQPSLFWQFAHQQEVASECHRGLRRAAVLSDRRIVDRLLEGCESPINHAPHCFGQSRHSATNDGRDPHLRQPFFFIYALRLIDTLPAKLRFLAGALQVRSDKATVWGVGHRAFRGILHRLLPRQQKELHRPFWMCVPGQHDELR